MISHGINDETQLSGNPLFLVLRRSQNLKFHDVFTFPKINDVLKLWDSTTRVSPLFPLNNSEFPDSSTESDWYLFFVGPIDLGSVDLNGLQAFLSYGIYNLVIVATVSDKSRVEQLLTDIDDTTWEAWQIKGTRIQAVEYSPSLMSPIDSEYTQKKSPDLAPELRSAFDEYRTLIAVTRSKCKRYLPDVVSELEEFDSIFLEILSSNEGHHVAKLGHLVNVNAALSRFSSQTFAGTSPIVETECHFWTHSLLGIGMASQSLVKLRRHYDEAMAVPQLVQKVKLLKSKQSNDSGLYKKTLSDSGWHRHRLEAVELKQPVSSDPCLRLIAFFSGRDGFRSTTFSLSAPLEVITGCNTFAWTLLTLTHELSHGVTNALLAALVGDLETPGFQQQLAEYLNPVSSQATKVTNELEQAQQILMWAYYFLERDNRNCQQKDKLSISAFEIKPMLQHCDGEMKELVTHLIDFLYFYQRDIQLYMTSIWSSWDVIPNIESRIDDYLKRSLTAILTLNMKIDSPFEETLSVVEQELKRISAQFKDSQYINTALQMLQSNKAEYLDKLQKRANIVKFVWAFFYDPLTAANMAREKPVAGARYANMRVLSFDSTPIESPLSFLVSFATDVQADAKKSLWMLHQLAFSVKT